MKRNVIRQIVKENIQRILSEDGVWDSLKASANGFRSGYRMKGNEYSAYDKDFDNWDRGENSNSAEIDKIVSNSIRVLTKLRSQVGKLISIIGKGRQGKDQKISHCCYEIHILLDYLGTFETDLKELEGNSIDESKLYEWRFLNKVDSGFKSARKTYKGHRSLDKIHNKIYNTEDYDSTDRKEFRYLWDILDDANCLYRDSAKFADAISTTEGKKYDIFYSYLDGMYEAFQRILKNLRKIEEIYWEFY